MGQEDSQGNINYEEFVRMVMCGQNINKGDFVFDDSMELNGLGSNQNYLLGSVI